MTKHCESSASGMIAFGLNAAQTEEILHADEKSFGDLSVACQNSHKDCVVSGPLTQIEAFQEYSKTKQYKCTRLDVPFAYHSASMEPITEELTVFASLLKLSKPAIPVGSNFHGRLFTPEDIVPGYFAKHARGVVRFTDELESLRTQNYFKDPLFLEIGPNSITLPMLKATLPEADNTYLASMQRKKNPWTSICESLGEMYLRGADVCWRKVYDGCGPKVVDLPGYPFAKSEFRIPYQENSSAAAEAKENSKDLHSKTGFDLLPIMLPPPSPEELPIYETYLSALSPLIDGHVVGGIALCPASVYYELALEAAQEANFLPPDESYRLDNIVYHHPLVHTSHTLERVIRVFLYRSHPSSTINSFQIFSYKTDIQDSLLHCSGSIKAQRLPELKEKLARRTAMCEKRGSQLLGRDIQGLDTFHTRTIYETIFPRVVSYSKAYQSIESMSISREGNEGYGTFQIPDALMVEKCIVQPVFIDTILHAAGFLVNSSVDLAEAYVCAKVESVKATYNNVSYGKIFKVYCTTLSWVDGTIFADAYALEAGGSVVAAIKGMHFRRLRLANLKTHLETLTKKNTASSEASEPSLSDADTDRTPSSSSSPLPNSPPSSSGTPPPQHTKVQPVVAQVIGDACGTSGQSIDVDRELESLGVDSLMGIEIAESLQSQFPSLSLEASELTSCSTQRDYEDLINSKAGTSLPQTEDFNEKVGTPKHQSHSSEADRSKVKPQIGKVKQTLKTVIGVGQAQVDSSTLLKSLGIDSLMSIEFLEALATEHKLHISSEELEACRTVGDVEYFEMGTSDGEKVPARADATTSLERALGMTNNPLTIQQLNVSDSPLFLVHDGSGLCNMYSKLRPMERAVYGFFNPGFFTSKEWAQEMSEMAGHYTSLIDTSASKSIILGGKFVLSFRRCYLIY